MFTVLVYPQKLAFLVKFGQAKHVLLKELDGCAICVESLDEGAYIALNVLYLVNLFTSKEYLSLQDAAYAAEVVDVVDDLYEER